MQADAQLCAMLAGALPKRTNIFAEAAATIARTGVEEQVTDTRIAGEAYADGFDVCTDGVAVLGNFVDQSDAARKEAVGRELGDNRRLRVCELQGSRSASLGERSIQGLHEFPGFGGIRADNDARGLTEIANRRTLSQKFGIGNNLKLYVSTSSFLFQNALDSVINVGRDGALEDDNIAPPGTKCASYVVCGCFDVLKVVRAILK